MHMLICVVWGKGQAPLCNMRRGVTALSTLTRLGHLHLRGCCGIKKFSFPHHQGLIRLKVLPPRNEDAEEDA